ncbi:DUF192 domain-containing protein [Litoreibacter janthinus]|uniref:DUF192 domain-containing protein n=1 Tax=Litoreibacter janthinus TaxID=670154 RepID=A0A1I6H454_9RHOB|nr:DUF192 domain-containing protein [Litoreibacter janthinus]SFR49208.1 hypothetical protein SAMN04488002_2485 [Litoreibacter janthinus]
MLSRIRDSIISAVFLTGFAAGGAFADSCTPNRVNIKGEFGSISFRVEIADDFQERATGLMNRDSLPMLSGMLFVYERPQPLAFWMRNTLIPLDMIFVEPTGKVAKIHANAVPLDETAISGGDGLTHVLEIGGGLAAKFGISEGDILQHSSFNQNEALWPCG